MRTVAIAFACVILVVMGCSQSIYKDHRVVGEITELNETPHVFDITLPASEQGVWELGIEGIESNDVANATMVAKVTNLAEAELYVRKYDRNVNFDRDVVLRLGEEGQVYEGTISDFGRGRRMTFSPKPSTLHYRLELVFHSNMQLSHPLRVVAFQLRPSP